MTLRDLLHALILRHGTNGFTSLPKEGMLRIFFALKNPTASEGFEPVNLGTKGQHATSRPPKPLTGRVEVKQRFMSLLMSSLIAVSVKALGNATVCDAGD